MNGHTQLIYVFCAIYSIGECARARAISLWRAYRPYDSATPFTVVHCWCFCCVLLFVGHCRCKPRNNFNGLMIFKPISFFFFEFFFFVRSLPRRSLHRCFRTSHSCCVRFFCCVFFFCYRLSFYLIHDLIAIWHNNVRAKPHATDSPIEFRYVFKTIKVIILWLLFAAVE